MAPTFDAAWTNGFEPLSKGQITEAQAFERGTEPFRKFMLAHTREADLGLFIELSQQKPKTRDETPLTTLAHAFLLSELNRPFEIGVLLLLHLLVHHTTVELALDGKQLG